MRFVCWLAAAACFALAGGATGASASTKPFALGAGQGVAVAGTDVVCAYGGPANQLGIACVHAGKKPSPYSFRISENEVLALQAVSGTAVRLGHWKQPTSSFAQPRSAAVSDFKLAGTLPVGGHFVAAHTDLGCSVYSFNGRTQVACFKFDSHGAVLNGSYAVALDSRGLQVSKFQGGRGTTVFVVGPK